MSQMGTKLCYLMLILQTMLSPTGCTLFKDNLPDGIPPPGPLPPHKINQKMADLGKHLFFDPRLSGDATISCATCHNPDHGWADGKLLGDGYPGTLYFRNTKSLLNASYNRYFFWDGRLSGKDLPTLVRDQLTETHFLNLDGRMAMMRLQQIPDYVIRFDAVFKTKDIQFGHILKALAEFVKTIRSTNTPFDNGTMSADAKAGYRLFKGKARCVLCHNGPNFTDNKPHSIATPENNRQVFSTKRHITMRSFFKFMGIDSFDSITEDVGFYAVTKEERHRRTFMTPSLRGLKYTAPYMHNGQISTLRDVLEFYDAGGGRDLNRDALLRPLKLTGMEMGQLLAFLQALSGDRPKMKRPPLFNYQVMKNWETRAN